MTIKMTLAICIRCKYLAIRYRNTTDCPTTLHANLESAKVLTITINYSRDITLLGRYETAVSMRMPGDILHFPARSSSQLHMIWYDTIHLSTELSIVVLPCDVVVAVSIWIEPNTSNVSVQMGLDNCKHAEAWRFLYFTADPAVMWTLDYITEKFMHTSIKICWRWSIYIFFDKFSDRRRKLLYSIEMNPVNRQRPIECRWVVIESRS